MNTKNSHAEAGFMGHSNPQRQYFPGFLSNDPFTPSITQSIRNHRMSGSIHGMDDVDLPSRTGPHHRYPHQLAAQQIPIFPAQQTQNLWSAHYASASPQIHRAYQAPHAPVAARVTQLAPSIPPRFSVTDHPDPVAVIRTPPRPRSPGHRRPSPEQSPVIAGEEVDILGQYDSDQSSKRWHGRSSVLDSHKPGRQAENDSVPRQDGFHPTNLSTRNSVTHHILPLSPARSPFQISNDKQVPENGTYAEQVEPSHMPTAAATATHSIPPPTPLPDRDPQLLHLHFTPPNTQSNVKDDHNPPDYSRPLRRLSARGSYVEGPDYVPLAIRDYIVTFMTDTLPRQIYLYLLLRLPYLYFSRVNRIFQEADLTMEEVKEMALQACAEDNKTFQYYMSSLGYYPYPELTCLPPAYQRLKNGWEHFIDDLMREWQTLNIISVLLLSAIMTMFQVQSAAGDPVTRYIAFWSLICALMSLLYGCLFIIRFGTMRKASKAAEWALEARRSQTIFWNVWVLLSMPVVWLSWSILTFIVCLMSFMWRAQANLPSDFVFSAAPSTELGFRIFICGILGIGVLYSVLIINTFRHYGTQMDEAWQRRVRSFILGADPSSTPPPPPPPLAWQFAQYPPSSPGPVAHQPSPPSRSRRLSNSDSGQTPYLTAGIGSRDLIGGWPQSKSAPQGDINVISPPSRSRSSPRKSLEHRPAYWYRRSHSPHNNPRNSSPGRSSSRLTRTRSPSPQQIEHEGPPHLFTLPHDATGPSMPSIDLQPQAKEERRNDDWPHSPNRYNRPASLDGGGAPIPPTKVPGEPSHVANIPVAKDEPEKLSPGYNQALSCSPTPSDSFKGRLEISEHQLRSLEGGHNGLKN